MPESIAVVADARPEDGRGHVCRSARVAAALRALTGGTVTYFVEDSTTAAPVLRAQGFAVELLPAAGLAEALPRRVPAGALTIIDSYRLPAAVVDRLAGAAGALLAFDDDGRLAGSGAPLLLNSAPGSTMLYSAAMAADGLPRQALSGLRWLPLAPALAAARGRRTPQGRLLVTMGGADPEQVTRSICRALTRAALPLAVDVVLGADYPDPDGLLREYAGDVRYTFHRGVQDLTELMGTASFAVTACGMTLWELCFLQVPLLALLTADNQRGNAQAAARAGLTVLPEAVPEAELAERLQAAWHVPVAAPAGLFDGWEGAGGAATAMVQRARRSALRRGHPVRRVTALQVQAEYRVSARQGEDWQRLRWGSEAGMHHRYARIAACLNGARRVVDIGCGTGGLRAVLPTATAYCGIDQVRPLLHAGLAAGRAGQLPLRADAADGVVLCGILQNCGEPPATLLRESARILAPGGTLVLLTKHLGWEQFLAGDLLPEDDTDWFFPEELALMLEACGLHVTVTTGFLPREGRDVPAAASHELLMAAVKP